MKVEQAPFGKFNYTKDLCLYILIYTILRGSGEDLMFENIYQIEYFGGIIIVTLTGIFLYKLRL